jgi:hypothetical protein
MAIPIGVMGQLVMVAALGVVSSLIGKLYNSRQEMH